MRTMIALAIIYKLEIYQMNIKPICLNDELKNNIYMEQPMGFVMPGKEDKVCKLIKSFYRFNQVPK